MTKMRTMGALLLAGGLALPGAASEKKTYSGEIAETKTAFTATIDVYTSDDDTFVLAEQLLAKGQQGLVAAVSKLKAGTVRFAKGASYNVNVIRTLQTEQGLIVAFVTDRPMNTDASRKAAGPGPTLGYLELLLNDDGTGGGRLIPGAKVIFNDEGYMEAETSGGQTFTVAGVTSK